MLLAYVVLLMVVYGGLVAITERLELSDEAAVILFVVVYAVHILVVGPLMLSDG